MKNYQKPVVITNGEMFEGVYAASGEGGYDLSFTVKNNNSGSLSVIEMALQLYLDHAGEQVAIDLIYTGPGDITDIRGASGADFSLNGKRISIVRNGHYNNGERIVLNINEMTFSERADGTTDAQNDNHHGSLYQTGTSNQDVTGFFVVENIRFL